MSSNFNILDINGNGKVDKEDIELAQTIKDIEKEQNKTHHQSRLAWCSMISMIIVTILLFVPFVSEARLTALRDILELYYVTQASIIGIFMGVNAYMSRQGRNTSTDYTSFINGDNSNGRSNF